MPKIETTAAMRMMRAEKDKRNGKEMEGRKREAKMRGNLLRNDIEPRNEVTGFSFES